MFMNEFSVNRLGVEHCAFLVREGGELSPPDSGLTFPGMCIVLHLSLASLCSC